MQLAALQVSTHSRLKAAGNYSFDQLTDKLVSTHSRLKAAGAKRGVKVTLILPVSTHSRLKAAGNQHFYTF